MKNTKIKILTLEVEKFYLDLVGYKPNETLLIELGLSEWNNYTFSRGYASNCSGIYQPRTASGGAYR